MLIAVSELKLAAIQEELVDSSEALYCAQFIVL